jgi:hypothetical protein
LINRENFLLGGVPSTSISISPLGTKRSQGVIQPLNISALTQSNEELNSQANVRDYLMPYITNLAITTSNSIKLQATSLAHLTQATNQLTRTTLVRKNSS